MFNNNPKILKKDQIISLLEDQFGAYLRDEEYKEAFDEALLLLSKTNSGLKSGTDNFYLFLHTLLIHVFGKVKGVEDKLRKWEEKINE